MRVLGLLCLMLIIADGCVDPLEVAIPEVKFQLVVDGFITNEPGPYTVKLYRARPLQTDLDRLVAERSARITLKDDVGNSEDLKEIGEGVYQTAMGGIQGQIGRKYHITIQTITGKRYFSDPEELLPTGSIDNVNFQFESRTSGDGFRIFVDANGVPNRDDLFRFRMVGTYKVETSPQLRTRRTDGGIIPDPYPCSGYIVDNNGKLAKSSPCTCCTCWVNQFDDIPSVTDEQFASNDRFSNIEVGFVPITDKTFYDKYRVEVQQMSLTPKTFTFWKLIRAQKIGTTDLFQPPAAPIRGNIHSIDSDEQPLGIFWSAGIFKKDVFIEREDVPYRIKPIETIVAPCQFFPYSSNQKPSFWYE